MGRIAIDTKEVRSLGRVLEATAQDLNRTTRRVRDRHQATQLNTARDPSVNQIQPGVNGVGYQLDRAAREYNRHAETATRTAREMEAADQLDLKPSLGPAGTKQSGWFPLPGLGNLPYIPIISGPWNQIPGNDSGGWTGFFGDGLQAGTAALDRARNGLNRFTGTVTNVGNRFIGGARGLLGRAGNFASDVQDKVGDTIHGVTNKVGDAWDWASGGISSAWNWGKDKLTTLIKDTWNNIWNGLTNTFHAAIEGIKVLAKNAVFAAWDAAAWALPHIDNLVDVAIDVGPFALLPGVLNVPGVLLWRRFVSPTLRRTWNEDFLPVLVTGLAGGAERLVNGIFGKPGEGGPFSGDLDARQPGGEFPVRVTDEAGAQYKHVDPDDLPFYPTGSTPTERGRSAIVETLENTANSRQIQADEFEVIDHGNGKFTIVLPGVTDLSRPDAGLSEQHRSVRDTDVAAASSAANATIEDNLYAQMVREYIEQNVPPGSDLAIVGHSFGADTAVDLASDPSFNGDQYNVTHVVAAAYRSESQLPSVQDGTEVLVLQNNRDLPVLVEDLGHVSSIEETFPSTGDGVIVDEFWGGRQGAGHHQNNYIDHVETTNSAENEAFFDSFADAGYADYEGDGNVTAVDVSVP